MNSHRQFVLGVFFVVAVSILAFYTLFLTDFTIFRDKIWMTFDFPNANALREGDSVLVAGKRIGRVKDIEFRPSAAPERRIRVRIQLDEPVEMLRGYSVVIEDSTFLGGHNVAIDPGPFGAPPAAPDADGAYLGSVRKNPLAALESVGDLVAENSEAVASFLSNLDQVLKDVRAGQGLAGRMIYDQALAENVSGAAADLRSTAAELREVIDSLRTGSGTLARLLNDDALYQGALETVESLRRVAADIESGEGVVGALLHDAELAQELRAVVRDVAAVARGLEAGEGVLGTLLQDEALAAEMRRMVANFVEASENVRAVAARLDSPDSTLGRLFTDDELYEELLVAVKLLSRSLEDYREAAPISAFTSAIFSAL